MPRFSSALEGVRILVVDDDPDMCEALQFLLESFGAEVTALLSSAAALAAFEASNPNVLLSDVVMPYDSGYDLMREITARHAGTVFPAAALSACAQEADRQQAIAAGFHTLLPKPIVPAVLLAVVAELAGRRLEESF